MSAACILCGANTKTITHPKIADFHYCENCEFISKDREHLISSEDELKIYNKHNNSIDDPRYVKYFNDFLEDAVFPYVDHVEKALDFGSGPSPVLTQLLERDHAYDMDIYDKFYAPAKVYKDKQYDLVLSTEVVEHLKSPLKYFELFVELLKPDGVLAVMTLFHHNDPEHFLKWHYVGDRSHISFYTPKTMEVIASKTGLKVIHTNNVRYTTFKLDA